MRSMLAIILIGASCGLIAYLLTADSDTSDGTGPSLSSDGAATGAGEERELLTTEEKPFIELVGKKKWPKQLVEESVLFGDSLVLDEVQVRSEDGQPYHITGADVLDVFEHQLVHGRVTLHFEDRDTLERFRNLKIPQIIPGEAPLRILVDNCMLNGFAFVAYAGRVYVTPIREGQVPGVIQGAPPPKPRHIPPEPPK